MLFIDYLVTRSSSAFAIQFDRSVAGTTSLGRAALIKGPHFVLDLRAGAPLANNLQQSWRFDWEPPKAVLRDAGMINWIWGG